MAKAITGKLLIGKSDKSGGASVRATNPASGVPLDPPFVVASIDDVDAACRLAASAFDEFRSTSPERRAAFLFRIADSLLSVGPELVERANSETGLSVERLETELARTVGQLRLFARVVSQAEWLDLRVDPELVDRKPFARPDIRLRQIALGPIAVFGSSNFPLAFSVAGGDTASALAAGCPVVVKGHLAHPGTGEIVGRCIQAAVADSGLPDGVFSLLNGANEIGAALVEHEAIKGVGFTGSRSGGISLSAIASSREEPIPVYAEMSSINPVYLLPAALRNRGAVMGDEFVGSLTLGAGQFCTNPGLIFAIDGPELDHFVSSALASLALVEPEPMLTAGIHQAFEKGVATFREHKRVSLLGLSDEPIGPNRGRAVFFETTAAVFARDPRLSDEVFGASSLLVRCRDEAEMLSITAAIEGQLTATLQVDVEDYPLAARLVALLERKVGRILANGWPTGVEVSDAMVHGGPFPATSDSRTTSVGTMAIRRFLRPVSYQNLPDPLLPQELRRDVIRSLPHLLDGMRRFPAR